MKLIIQIPCFNEEETLPQVFEKMPKSIPGIDIIEYQIIDDCSTDRTVEVAKELGAGKKVLAILSDNGERYLSTALYEFND